MALSKVLNGMLNDFSKDYIFDDMSLSKKFEYMVNYIIISKYHPDAFSDKGDLDRVVVDEKGQFGLDAVAFIANGNLVLSKDDISVCARDGKLDVSIIFIQTKTEEKCDTGDLLKTIHATKNFLKDFEAINEKNSNILEAKEIYDEIFRYDKYQHTNQSPKCFIYFVTAADEWDEGMVNNICESSKKEMKDTIRDIKGFDIQVIGKDYVMEAYNEIKNKVSVTLNLKNCITLEKINGVKEAYLGYVTGEDYLKLICNHNGELRRSIFYENVRDYQGRENNVNREIRGTIENQENRGQFILLNNGVTVITKSVLPLGANEYELSDFQIVNGCQTSNEIFNCKNFATDIFVPIKIIYTTDMDVIANIVKATNRQSPVPEEAFVSLSIYHKELQLLFSEYSKELPIEMFYERRSGEQDDIKEKRGDYQITTLHGIIRAFVSVYMQKPNLVYGTNPANILKSNKEKLFCKSHKKEIYYISSYLFVKFVSLQQERIFSRHDYAYRFYIIMIVRMLMLKKVDVLDLSSKEIKKENERMIALLKDDDCNDYFIEAKNIIEKVINQGGYINRNRHDYFRNVDFCKKIINETKNYIK